MPLPISVVIATRSRATSLGEALESLLSQNLLPAEFIVVDASDNEATKQLLTEFERRVQPDVAMRWLAANVSGAASQRNQGVPHATQPFIWSLMMTYSSKRIACSDLGKRFANGGSFPFFEGKRGRHGGSSVEGARLLLPRGRDYFTIVPS